MNITSRLSLMIGSPGVSIPTSIVGINLTLRLKRVCKMGFTGGIRHMGRTRTSDMTMEATQLTRMTRTIGVPVIITKTIISTTTTVVSASSIVAVTTIVSTSTTTRGTGGLSHKRHRRTVIRLKFTDKDLMAFGLSDQILE
ncbi:hypothetical protein HanRHA438_Chr04g0172801 [Helianthus annuus]|nr:hypothetical protein HanIR_Chr04g0175871 [Helianthus annuus]KAJ0796184.1 hypothetical protein HanPI659440_Chr04g0159271 [Helianthus annuus]KAJ0926575.1 hypothetical protein HanRHA438_Chr04g0172801 [Helianthus annuus]